MPTTRRRRIVRRAVMVLAGVVLLLGCYAGSWIGATRARQAGHISGATLNLVTPLYTPLVVFCHSGLPGADALSRIWWRVNEHGNVVTRRGDVPVAPPHPSD